LDGVIVHKIVLQIFLKVLHYNKVKISSKLLWISEKKKKVPCLSTLYDNVINLIVILK